VEARARLKVALRIGVEIASHARAAESSRRLTRVAMSRAACTVLVLEYGSRL